MRHSGSCVEQSEVVCCLALGDTQAYYHLVALARSSFVSRLWIIRDRTIQIEPIPKAEYIVVSTRWRPLRLLRMFFAALRLARREQVRAFVSFNPLPYGLLAGLAASLCGRSVHYGFIGTDWNLRMHGWLGRLLRPILRRGALITAPGTRMLAEMQAHRFPQERLAVLPHSIDVDRFQIGEPARATYTCIFVGRLVPVKRVDLILRGFARVRNRHPEVRLCVVGAGPLAGACRRLAADLGIERHVTFVGQTAQVDAYLADSRILLCASDAEGLPFALIEGLSVGLVPVSTPAGSIPDVVVHGENGLLVPFGSAAALAEAICRLIEDPDLYQRLRRGVLDRRDSFRLGRATEFWDKWLSSVVVGDRRAVRESDPALEQRLPLNDRRAGSRAGVEK